MSNKSHNKVLLITRNMPPLIGGMETLMLKTAQALAENHQLTVIAPKGSKVFLPADVEVIETPLFTPFFLLTALIRSIWLARTQTITMIIGGSSLVAPILRILQILFKNPTVCFVHGLDIIVDNLFYQRLFKPCLKYFDLLIANSRNTKRLAVEAGAQEASVAIINPGCNTGVPTDKHSARLQFDQQHNTHQQFILLFVGRITPRKGLLKFLQQGFPKLIELKPDCHLFIAGESADQSLTTAGSEKQSVLDCVSENRWHERVHFLGKVDDQTLEQCYLAADCLLFPLTATQGDVEGFGMVAIEAAAHGTPTVAFEEGGVSDAIQNNISGHLVPPGDYGTLAQSIARLNPCQKTAIRCREFAEKFSWKNYKTQLNQKLNELNN